MKQLLFEDSKRIENERQNIAGIIENIEPVITEFNSMDLNTEITFSILEDIFQDPDAAIRQIFINRLPDEIAPGVKTDKEKMLSNIVLPDLKKFKTLIRDARHFDFVRAFLKMENEKLIIVDEPLNEYFDKYRIFSTNKNEIAAMQDFEKFVEVINDFNDKYSIVAKANVGTAGVNIKIDKMLYYKKDNIELNKKEIAGHIRGLYAN